MDEQLSKAEIRKDALQDGVQAATHAVGEVATIVTAAVGEVAKAVGGFATELFEIRDSVRRATEQSGQSGQEGQAEPGDTHVSVEVVPGPDAEPTADSPAPTSPPPTPGVEDEPVVD